MAEEYKIRKTDSWVNGATAAAMVIESRRRNGQLDGLDGLRACQKRLNITTNELSRRTGITKESLRAWRCGLYYPSAHYLPILANALRCSIEELYLGPAEEDGER